MSSFIFSSAWLSDSKNTINYIANKGIINHVDDEDYTYLCGDNESNLTVIEDEDNMMNPNNLNITKGKVSLKDDMKLTINDEAYYTFVIFLSDAYDVRNVNFGTGNCIRLDYSPVTIDNQIETFTIEDDATSGSTPTELFNNGSTNRLNLYTENFNQLFIEFYIPRTESYCRRVQISSFCFGFNTAGSCGTVEHVQLYKSQMNLDKPWSEYNHEPCGITEDAGGPYQDGYKYYLALDYESDLTIEDLENSLMAYDFGDGQYHDVELVTDNYTNNRNTLETDLEVVFSATDSRGNTSTFTYCIVISDNVAPSIVQLNESINFSYEEELTQQKLLACFSFSDNYLNQIDSTQIQNFDFDLEENFVGTFTFTVEAKDISGNICLLDSSANMIDDVAPVISGDDEIVIKAGDVLTDADILSHYSAFDEIDGETDVEIKNNGLTGNTNNIGLYTCEIESIDSSNNIALKTIFLQVTDSDGPSFYVNESIITQYGTHMISSDEIIQSLVRTNQLPEKNYVYSEFLYGNYKGENGEIAIGTYSERVSAHADDGSIEYSNVTIVVKSIIDSETNSKTSFWSTLLSWFSNLWKSICQFFANLFNF
jgi:hypothetical protein